MDFKMLKYDIWKRPKHIQSCRAFSKHGSASIQKVSRCSETSVAEVTEIKPTYTHNTYILL